MPAEIVLFVDDDEEILDACASTVRGAYEARLATRLQTAKQRLDEGVDVLVCDLRLGDASGLDVIQHAVRAAKIPRIIAMSGEATPGEAFAAAAAGARWFLAKPFGPEQLHAALAGDTKRATPIESLIAGEVGARTLADVQVKVRRAMVRQAVARAGGNQRVAAKLLGLTRQRVHQILHDDEE